MIGWDDFVVRVRGLAHGLVSRNGVGDKASYLGSDEFGVTVCGLALVMIGRCNSGVEACSLVDVMVARNEFGTTDWMTLE